MIWKRRDSCYKVLFFKMTISEDEDWFYLIITSLNGKVDFEVFNLFYIF